MNITDDELIEFWLAPKAKATQMQYGSLIQRFRLFIRKSLADVTIGEFVAFLNSFQDPAPASYNTRLVILRSLYALGFSSGVLPHNHAMLVPRRKVRSTRAGRVPTQSDMAEVLKNRAPVAKRLTCELLYILGLRAIEVRRLKLVNIREDLDGFLFHIMGKHASPRVVRAPLSHKRLCKDLRKQIEHRLAEGAGPHDPLIVGSRDGQRLAHGTVVRWVYEAGKKAGLKKVLCPHLLRHAHISHALDNRAPPHLVKDSVGLKCMSTMSRYAHPARQPQSPSYIEPLT